MDAKLANRYEINRELGRGGMGVVYLGYDPLLEREVAIKLIAPAFLNEEKEERFKREARIVAKMDHPAIVPVYDIGEHNGSLFFVMPFVSGVTLREILKDTNPLLLDVVEIGIQIAEALDYSHSLQIIHRDIKPENIMVAHSEKELRVRITDYGIAKASFEKHITQSGALVGTVAYLSPEQVSEDKVDSRSDIYSLGAVLYECLTGQTPFVGKFQAVLSRIVNELPAPIHSKNPTIDDELSDLVMKCLEKSPDHRPQRGHDIAEALRRYQNKMPQNEYSKTMLVTSKTAITGEHNTTLETQTIHSQKPVMNNFIGRERELAELHRRLSSASAGECQFIVIPGEPGVGKSRLMERFADSIKISRSRVLHGRFVDQDRAFPYQGFCEILQEYFRASAIKKSSNSIDFSDLAGDLSTLFPVLTEVEQLRSVAQTSSKLNLLPTEPKREQDRTFIFELLARTLIRIGSGKMLILMLEDLHAADVSLDALQYITRRMAATPLLIIGTYRSTEIDKRHPLVKLMDGFRGDRNYTTLPLEPFSQAEHRTFLESMLSEAKWDEQFIEKSYQATEGNPFFLKELIQSLIESQKLVQDSLGDWLLSSEIELSSETLPATVQQTIERRIERLSDELRDLLSIAAVLGKTFDFKDLEFLAEDHNDLDDAIEQLIKNGFLVEERQSRGDRLSFSSGVVRDVLYGGLTRRKRRNLHRKYAEELERRHPGRTERVYAQLVHHYAQSDVAEKVVVFGLKLAKRSLSAFCSEDAIWAARLVLDFLDDSVQGSHLIEGEARLILGGAHQLAGNIDLALKELAEAIKIFQDEQESLVALSAMLLLAETAWEGRRFDKTKYWVEQGLEIARHQHDQDSLTRLLSLGATVANLRGDYERAREYLSELDLLQPEHGDQSEPTQSGGRLVAALAAPVAIIDPVNIKLSDEAEVLANIFETLITIDRYGRAVPQLCHWEPVQDGHLFQLTICADARFHDGRRLTAVEIQKCFERAIKAAQLALPAAFIAIRGVTEFINGESETISGISIIREDRLLLELNEPLPIYPVLLSDVRTAIASESTDANNKLRMVGTGPFKIIKAQPSSIVLDRNNEYWRGKPATLDAIEFRTGLSSSEIAEGFRNGIFDLARDLSWRDLDAILRDRSLRIGLIETTKKNTYFVLFNQHSHIAANESFRHALCGVVNIGEMVRTTLGRFAHPAQGLFPPGVLGYEPGRRRPSLSLEKARKLIGQSGDNEPIELRVALHPVLQDCYGPFIEALFQRWSELNLKIVIVTSTMNDYLSSSTENDGIDLMIGRWSADYDDPDNFTYGLFHSHCGLFRNYYSSTEFDRLVEAARAELRTDNRELLYHKIDDLLLSQGLLLPLFHDIDFRVANPAVRRLTLNSIPPYANYREITRSNITSPQHTGGGIITVPVIGQIDNLDPSMVITMVQAEALPTVFETLTRQIESARIVPWLVAQYRAEASSRRYWFRLRDDITFHDGRRLTSRDVRYSFERLLRNKESESRWLFVAIRGAKELMNGESDSLVGFQIQSLLEFTIDLVEPLSFFPALLAHPSAAIIPEGMSTFNNGWRDGCVGTGPFRVLRFTPGHRLELEANPYYWRGGFPKCDGLTFTCLAAPIGTLAEFRAGRFSIVSELPPADVEALRHDNELGAKYRETPSLSTYFIAFNINQGAMAKEQMRRRVAQMLDVEGLVRRNLGRLAITAQTLSPPGLLGYEPIRAVQRTPISKMPSNYNAELSCVINPVLESLYANFTHDLTRSFLDRGLRIKVVDMKSEYRKALAMGSIDIFIGRWIADYPDADSFIYGLLHSEKGAVGKLCGSPQLDRSIEEARTETNLERRHSIYRDIEHIVQQNVLMLPLFHEQAYRFARPEVEGFEVGLYPPLVSYEKIWIKK